MVVNFEDGVVTIWLAVDVFQKIQLLHGRRLQKIIPKRIRPMFFCVSLNIWEITNILHIYNNFINEWIDFIV